MVKKSHGPKVKTRKKLTQKPGYRPPITKFLQDFQIGQNVAIDPEPSSHKGMPHSKFKGLAGKVIAKRGRSYVVKIRVGNSKKVVISRPEHLRTT